MEKQTDFKLGDDGHEDPEVETQEQLDASFKRLSDLAGGGTSMVTMSKQDLSLMKHMLTAASEEFKEQTMWRMCSFLDEDEALDHVAAFYEAKDLGMDTGFNVAFIFALVSVHRKTAGTNLISQILGALQMSKWAQHSQKGKSNGHNPRSPLD